MITLLGLCPVGCSPPTFNEGYGGIIIPPSLPSSESGKGLLGNNRVFLIIPFSFHRLFPPCHTAPVLLGSQIKTGYRITDIENKR